MKIALVHSFYRAGPSGENRAVEAEIKALCKAGHKVHLIARSSDRLASNPFSWAVAGLTVATGHGPNPLNQINDLKPDIVQIHNLFPNWSDRWVKNLEIPLVTTFHNYRPLCSAGTLVRNGLPCELCPSISSVMAVRHRCYQNSALRTVPLAMATRRPKRNLLLTHSDRAIFKAQSSLQTFAKYSSAELVAKASVVPNFSDPGIRPSAKPLTGRSAWVFIGRLASEKGILELLEAWPRSEHLDVFGSGPLNDKAKRLSVGKSVAFHGFVPHETMLQQARDAIGLVFPSLAAEQNPLAFIDALSLGIPVLAKTGNAAADETLESGCGTTFEDFEGIERAMKRLRLGWATFSKAAKDTHAEKFSVSAWNASIHQVYESALVSRNMRLKRA